MSDPIYPSTPHPDELLAGYVDGTGTTDERRVVDEHIAVCATCHEEVDLATVARAALVSLPELGAAGLAEAGVASLRRAAFQTIPALVTSAADPAADSHLEPARSAPATPRRDRQSRRSKVAWPQFLAAAAVVIVLGGLVAVPIVLSNHRGTNTASAPSPAPAKAAPTAASGPVLIDNGAAYTTTTLDALATTITATARTALAEAGPATPSIRFAAPSNSVVRDSSAVSAALACLQSGGGPQGNAQPFYLERAEVSGVPAYVGAFFIPDTKLNVMLIAVSRDGCQPLYSVRQSA